MINLSPNLSLDLPPAAEVETLLHLIDHERYGTAARDGFLALEDSQITNALRLLFGQLSADGFHAFHQALRKLDVLFDDDWGRLLQLGDLTKPDEQSIAQSARWYLATKSHRSGRNMQSDAVNRAPIDKPRSFEVAIRTGALPNADDFAVDFMDRVWIKSPRDVLYALNLKPDRTPGVMVSWSTASDRRGDEII